MTEQTKKSSLDLEKRLADCGLGFRRAIDELELGALSAHRKAVITKALDTLNRAQTAPACRSALNWSEELLSVASRRGYRMQTTAVFLVIGCIAAISFFGRTAQQPQTLLAVSSTEQALALSDEDLPLSTADFDGEYTAEAQEMLAQGLSIEETLMPSLSYPPEDYPSTEDFIMEVNTNENDIFDS